jgi:hypothetical protein
LRGTGVTSLSGIGASGFCQVALPSMEERRTAASKRQPPSLSAAQQIATKLTTMTAAASPTELFASSTKKPRPNAITKASSISPQPMNSNFSLSRHMAEFNAE